MSELLEQKLLKDFENSFNQRYKREMVRWVEEGEFDYFVTLTFKDNEITEYMACRALKLFNIWVNRGAFTNQGVKKGRRVLMMPFIEENAWHGYHFHIFVKIPDDITDNHIKRIMQYSWCRLDEAGEIPFSDKDKSNNHKWFIPIYHAGRLSKYVLKQSTNLKIDNLVADLICK
jgi:hypothetical protein